MIPQYILKTGLLDVFTIVIDINLAAAKSSILLFKLKVKG